MFKIFVLFNPNKIINQFCVLYYIISQGEFTNYEYCLLGTVTNDQ